VEQLEVTSFDFNPNQRLSSGDVHLIHVISRNILITSMIWWWLYHEHQWCYHEKSQNIIDSCWCHWCLHAFVRAHLRWYVTSTCQGRYPDEQIQDLWDNRGSAAQHVGISINGGAPKYMIHNGKSMKILLLYINKWMKPRVAPFQDWPMLTPGMVPVLPKLLEQGTPEQRADRDYVLKVCSQ